MVIAIKVKAKVTPPISPLRSEVKLSSKYAKQEGNPKPKDKPHIIETAQIMDKLEVVISSIIAVEQTPRIIHIDNNLLRPILSIKRFPKNAEPAIAK